ncbi:MULTISPECIES: SRPBCC family protein [Sphingobacterium]|uniref:SRPBCC family protein n=1 Tax=Sphingobacterium TaxID=28453 RepID=UPI0013DB5884|nr:MULTISPECIES: SRPBCC domain-containing protein [unclassified Sphingobacterium]
MVSIELVNYIKAPASLIYQVLTTEEGLAKIWTKKLIVKPEVGFINEFDFNEAEITKMKIIELQENSRIYWECVDSDKEWIGTRVSFDLSERNNQTAVILKHSDWRAVTEYYQWCNYNWSMFLQRLKTHCESLVQFGS